MAGTLEIPKRGKRQIGEIFSVVVRDVQFWIPVAVLAAGLVVLGWIS
jgi:hypothetical protein